MNRMLGGAAAGLAAATLLLASPASADFFIKKAQPKAATPPTSPPRVRTPPRRPRPSEARIEEAVAAPAPVGIDPALMEQAVNEAQYSARLVRDPANKTAVLEVTGDGKSGGWSVNFKDCEQDNQCGAMEFYTLWRVSNEANVCTVWGNDVARDPTRNLGKPFCYVVRDRDKQLHLKLSSEQLPYLGLDKMAPDAAKERMRSMIGVWSTSLTQLPQAWEIAKSKCPKATDRCTNGAVVNIPPPGKSR